MNPSPQPQPESDLVREWGRLWRVADLAERVHIEWSTRTTASAGRCQPSTGRIRLNARLTGDERVSTLCHEAAHVAARLLHRCPVCHYTRRDRARAPRWACPVCLEGGETRVLEVVAEYRT